MDIFGFCCWIFFIIYVILSEWLLKEIVFKQSTNISGCVIAVVRRCSIFHRPVKTIIIVYSYTSKKPNVRTVQNNTFEAQPQPTYSLSRGWSEKQLKAINKINFQGGWKKEHFVSIAIVQLDNSVRTRHMAWIQIV